MNFLLPFIKRYIVHQPKLVKVINNISWLFLDRILRMGVGLLVGVWIARYLGPEKFGLLNYATAFVALFSVVVGLGFPNIVVRDIVHDSGAKEEILGTAIFLQFITGLLTYLILIFIIFWLRSDNTELRYLMLILGSIMIFRFGDIAIYWFESQIQSRYTVWVQNTVFLLFTVLKIGLVLNNASLADFAWVMSAEAILTSVCMTVMLNIYGPRLHQLKFKLERAKKLLVSGWPLLLSGMAVMVYMKIDQIMLGEMLDDKTVGIYSAAVRASEVWYFIPTAIVATLYPLILDAKKQDEEKYLQLLQRLYDLMTWLAISLALPLTFFSKVIMVLLFGPLFEASGDVLALHIWTSIFVFLGIAGNTWYTAENRQILIFQKSIIAVVINIALNFLLISDFGVIGAAFATLIAQAMAAMFSDYFYEKTRPMFFMKLKSFNLFGVITRIKSGNKFL